MKKIFFILSMIVIVLSVVFAVSADSVDYKDDFYKALTDKKWTEADSILTAWEKALPKASELYPARFNYYLNKSHRSTIGIYSGAPETGMDDAIVFSDSAGNEVGYFGPGEETWNDSIFQLGVGVINRGIAAFPRRLDFPFGKASALDMNKSYPNRWIEIRSTVMNVLDNIDGDWYWTDDVKLDTDSAALIIQDTSYKYLSDMAFDESYVMAFPLAEKMVEKFPDDYKSLNILGVIQCFELKMPEIGIGTLEKALSIKPDDGSIANNIAYIYLQMGDSIAALERYRSNAENPIFDNESVEQAKYYVKRLTEAPEVLRNYTYFFGMLPMLAQFPDEPKAIEMLKNVKFFNEVAPEYYYEKVSPFKNDDITIDEFRLDGRTILVMTFPDPDDMPLCKYVAFVTNGDRFTYYTLEKSMKGQWILGSQDDDSHTNFGWVPYPENAQGFAEILQQNGFPTK